MSLRARLALLGALAVAVTVVIVSVISYLVVEDRVRIDARNALQSNVERLADLPAPELALPFFKLPYAGPTYYMQVLAADGRTQIPESQRFRIPVTDQDLRTAAVGGPTRVRDVEIGGHHVLIATAPASGDKAVQLARAVDGIDQTLDDLGVTLLIIVAGAVAAAALLGLLLARAGLNPVRKLTRAAEHVATTQDLGSSIDVNRRDELGRLATSLNAMLAALDGSRKQQRQLVADASHELRTPLTSLRTNIEVLGREADIPPVERERLLADVSTQLGELTDLVDDLVELAREEAGPVEAPTEIELDQILANAVNRARLRAPDVHIVVDDLPPTRMHGQRQQVERALVNLLDNACKWSPPGGSVEVALAGDVITVRDHGPGIDEQDLPRVFDRFFRAPAARALPGSGLGLAIVRQVVDGHGGSVMLGPAPGGGTLATVRLPVTADVGSLNQA